MFKSIIVSLFLLSIFTMIFASTNFRHQLDPYNPEYKPGEILIKFTDEVELQISSNRGIIETGVNSLDVLSNRWQVTEMEKVFKNSEKKAIIEYNVFPNGEKRKIPQLFNIYKISVPVEKDLETLIKEYEKNPNVEYAEYNGIANIIDFQEISNQKIISRAEIENLYNRNSRNLPNDPLINDQWSIFDSKADSLWSYTTGDTSQVIAILDTGVDWNHPDLQNKIWLNYSEINGVDGIDDDDNGFIDDYRGWDFVNLDNNPMDDSSHGTHCAGIAAAETDNGIGIAGVSWGAKIMPVKVFQSSGIGYFSQIAEGFWYAAENGATIYSNSWSSSGESLTIRNAMEYAYAFGLIVAASGNMNYKTDFPFPPWPPTVPNYPACYNWVIGCEATTQNGDNTWFSNYDPTGPVISDGRPYGLMYYNYDDFNYEVRAPGLSMISTVPYGGYAYYSGTSMSAPLVAGSIALMKSYDPNLSNEMVFAKLIQPIKINILQAGVLDILTSTLTDPPPDLYFSSYSVSDTLDGCDFDGRPDAGETVNIFITVKNAGGNSDSTFAKLRFAAYEDTTTANIIEPTCELGSISAYGMNTSFTPIVVEIDSNVVHMRDISFQLLIWSNDASQDTLYQNVVLSIEHGEEISGSYQTLHLSGDAFYLVSDIAVIDSLIIDPGVTLTFSGGMFMAITSSINAVGTPDSLITFTGFTEGYYWNGIVIADDAESKFSYCNFRYGGISNTLLDGVYEVTDCYFEYCRGQLIWWVWDPGIFERNVITNHSGNTLDGAIRLGGWAIYDASIKNNIFAENVMEGWKPNIIAADMGDTDTLSCLYNNVFINNDPYNMRVGGEGLEYKYIQPNYWGTIDEEFIHTTIHDFYEDQNDPVAVLDGILNSPPSECHGVVWKVEINGQNPQEDLIDPIDGGQVRFDVYFNRAMDPVYEPFVTFGVRYPFTQNIVQDSTSWSADLTMWTGYTYIGNNSGDGINTIRVAYARDLDHFEIPIERSRFQFIIQAAGSQSVAFMATPGIGKVDLEWPFAETSVVMGYNMYRFESITDSTFSDTTLINTELITDSTYTDFAVIPDTTYHYLYKIVGTDMQESDYSKVVSATPFNATPGDANGDLVVNVLDITSIVNYLLNLNPEPFLFDGADANQDGQVNVLDIVEVVNIIMGSRSSSKYAMNKVEGNPQMLVDATSIRLKNGAGIAAMQFSLTGSNITEDTRLIAGKLLGRMEYSYSVSNDTIYVVLYNLNNNPISNNNGTLFTLSEGQIKSVNNVIASDTQGQQIMVDYTPEENIVPLKFTVSKNYPNPFNPTTKIDYALPTESDVVLSIYNIKGQLVKRIKHENQPAGYHQIVWQGRNDNNRRVASGVYFYRLKAGKYEKTKKMLLLK